MKGTMNSVKLTTKLKYLVSESMKSCVQQTLPDWHPCYICLDALLRRKSQQAEREYEKVKHQLENLEESVRDRCKKEFTGTSACLRPNAPQRIIASTKL